MGDMVRIDIDEAVPVIVTFVSRRTLLHCACVSRTWYAASMRPPLWRGQEETEQRIEEKADADDSSKRLCWLKLDELRYRNSPREKWADRNRRSLFSRCRWEISDWSAKEAMQFQATKEESPIFFVSNQAEFRLICYPMGAQGASPSNRGIALYLEAHPREQSKVDPRSLERDNLSPCHYLVGGTDSQWNWSISVDFILKVRNQNDDSKSVTWSTGGMHSYAFSQGTETWGRHCLVPHSKLREEVESNEDGQTEGPGFIKDDKCVLEAEVVVQRLECVVVEASMPCLANHDDQFGLVSSQDLEERSAGSSNVRGAARYFGRLPGYPYSARFKGMDYQGEESGCTPKGDNDIADIGGGESKSTLSDSSPSDTTLEQLDWRCPILLDMPDSCPPSLLRDVALDALASRRAILHKQMRREALIKEREILVNKEKIKWEQAVQNKQPQSLEGKDDQARGSSEKFYGPELPPVTERISDIKQVAAPSSRYSPTDGPYENKCSIRQNEQARLWLFEHSSQGEAYVPRTHLSCAKEHILFEVRWIQRQLRRLDWEDAVKEFNERSRMPSSNEEDENSDVTPFSAAKFARTIKREDGPSIEPEWFHSQSNLLEEYTKLFGWNVEKGFVPIRFSTDPKERAKIGSILDSHGTLSRIEREENNPLNVLNHFDRAYMKVFHSDLDLRRPDDEDDDSDPNFPTNPDDMSLRARLQRALQKAYQRQRQLMGMDEAPQSRYAYRNHACNFLWRRSVYGLDRCNRTTVFLERPSRRAYEILMDFHDAIKDPGKNMDSASHNHSKRKPLRIGLTSDDGWYWRCTGVDDNVKGNAEEINLRAPTADISKYLYAQDKDEAPQTQKFALQKSGRLTMLIQDDVVLSTENSIIRALRAEKIEQWLRDRRARMPLNPQRKRLAMKQSSPENSSKKVNPDKLECPSTIIVFLKRLDTSGRKPSIKSCGTSVVVDTNAPLVTLFRVASDALFKRSASTRSVPHWRDLACFREGTPRPWSRVPAEFFQATAYMRCAGDDDNKSRDPESASRRPRMGRRRRPIFEGQEGGGISIQPHLNLHSRGKFLNESGNDDFVVSQRPITTVTGDVCSRIFTSNEDISINPSVVDSCHAALCLAIDAQKSVDAKGRKVEPVKSGRDFGTWRLLTIADAGILSGDIFTFVDLRDFEESAAAEAACAASLQNSASKSGPAPPLALLSLASAAVAEVYNEMLAHLYHRLDTMLSQRLSVHNVDSVLPLTRDFGVQNFRVFSAYEKRNENASAALKHFSVGRHCGFVCDRCGSIDFDGVRYKCQTCDDFDLCQRCQHSIFNEGAPSDCRYKYSHERKQWVMVKGYNQHRREHHMRRVVPIPGVLVDELNQDMSA